MNVQGHYKTSYDELNAPGDFMFSEGETTIIIICPCGCTEGNRFCVGTSREGQKPKVWALSGPKESPTLSPSILRIGNCGWHGHLVNGVWIPC